MSSQRRTYKTNKRKHGSGDDLRPHRPGTKKADEPSFAPTPRSPKEEVRAELSLLESLDGDITPNSVLERARDPKNVLHGEFEWDDAVAGHKFRLDQARDLISSYRVTFTVQPRNSFSMSVEVAQWVHPPTSPGVQKYCSVDNLKADTSLAKAFLNTELEKAMTYLKKAADYAAILGVGAEAISSDIAEMIEVLQIRIMEWNSTTE